MYTNSNPEKKIRKKNHKKKSFGLVCLNYTYSKYINIFNTNTYTINKSVYNSKSVIFLI